MFDVIIVGGRVAGGALAARLGMAGLHILLLERSTHPSVPAASSPVIYAPAMQLLDEIGADETQYAANTPRLHRWFIEAENAFRVEHTLPMVLGRSYAYAVERGRFDAALWHHAASLPTVEARQQHTVTDLLWDGNRVSGVTVKNVATGELQTHHAALVVGADGRFSAVARKVNAAEHSHHTSHPTSVYYAYWRGVTPPDGTGPPSTHLFSPGGDYGILLMDSADGTTGVTIEGRSDVMSVGQGGAQQFYLQTLQRHPAVWARLAHAEQVTPVKGMKRIGNVYRQGGGPGWALVGDAVHQKDPLDGQGIYNALFTAKALANAIIDWRCHHTNWTQALTEYEQAVIAETRPMYHATMGRVQREIYTKRPHWFMKTFARWLYEDERYRDHWGNLFVRQVDPQRWFSWQALLGPVLRGLWRQLSMKCTNFLNNAINH